MFYIYFYKSNSLSSFLLNCLKKDSLRSYKYDDMYKSFIRAKVTNKNITIWSEPKQQLTSYFNFLLMSYCYSCFFNLQRLIQADKLELFKLRKLEN